RPHRRHRRRRSRLPLRPAAGPSPLASAPRGSLGLRRGIRSSSDYSLANVMWITYTSFEVVDPMTRELCEPDANTRLITQPPAEGTTADSAGHDRRCLRTQPCF